MGLKKLLGWGGTDTHTWLQRSCFLRKPGQMRKAAISFGGRWLHGWVHRGRFCKVFKTSMAWKKYGKNIRSNSTKQEQSFCDHKQCRKVNGQPKWKMWKTHLRATSKSQSNYISPKQGHLLIMSLLMLSEKLHQPSAGNPAASGCDWIMSPNLSFVFHFLILIFIKEKVLPGLFCIVLSALFLKKSEVISKSERQISNPISFFSLALFPCRPSNVVIINESVSENE